MTNARSCDYIIIIEALISTSIKFDKPKKILISYLNLSLR